MSAPIPCKICGCIVGEPGLCHAVVPSGTPCYRPQGYPDWCSACGTWDLVLRINNPGTPIEALAAAHRSERALAAAGKRGQSVPGEYALRVHAVRMRRVCERILKEAGLAQTTDRPAPPEKDRPLCPQSL